MRKKHTFKTLVAGLLLLVSIHSQGISFIKTYPPLLNVLNQKIIQLSNNSYLLAGYHDYLHQLFIVKISPNGDTVYTRHYSDSFSNIFSVNFQYIEPSDDRYNFVFLGSDNNGKNYLMELSTDSNGKEILVKKYPQPDTVGFIKVIPDNAGGFILSAQSLSYYYILEKIDSNFNVKWQKLLYDTAIQYSDMQFSNNIIYIAGSFSYNALEILKMDTAGNIINFKKITFQYPLLPSTPFLINVYNDQSIIICGENTISHSKMITLHIPANLDTFQYDTLSFHNPQQIGDFLTMNVILSDTLTNNSSVSYWEGFNSFHRSLVQNISIFDKNAKQDSLINMDSLGGYFVTMAATSDGGMILAGTNINDTAGMYVVKLSPSEIKNAGIAPYLSKYNTISFYPDPAANSITIKGVLNTNYSLDIYNVTGALVATFQKQQGDMNIILDRAKLVSGAYMVKITTAGGDVYEGKLILE